jgi:hypothetical protein
LSKGGPFQLQENVVGPFTVARSGGFNKVGVGNSGADACSGCRVAVEARATGMDCGVEAGTEAAVTVIICDVKIVAGVAVTTTT